VKPKIRILAPLRSRNFALLWGGMAISLLGDGVYLVAIAWEALRLSNTTMAISLVGIAWMLPTVVLLLFGGALSDRADRRWLMLGASLVQALATGLIGLLVTLGAANLSAILVLVAVYGGANAFFLPAFESIVPMLLSPDELAQASAVEQFIRPLAFALVGPAVGGVLIAVSGTGTAFLVDAGTFLVPVCAVLAIRLRGRPVARQAPARRSLTEIADAIRFVRANQWLSRTLLAAAMTMLLFVGPFQVLLPFVVKNGLHAGSGTLGMIRACGGAGALIGAIAVGQRGVPGWPIRAMLVGWALQCLTLAGFALAADGWLFAAISLVGGAFGAAANVVWGAMMKTRVPNDMLGRVASLDWLVSIGFVPVSYAITGPVAQALGAQATLLGAGGLAAATLVWFAWRSPVPLGSRRRLAAGVASGPRLRAAGGSAVGRPPVRAPQPVSRTVRG
jgi:MFS family permease